MLKLLTDIACLLIHGGERYTWDDADRALRTLSQWSDLGIFFCETPLPLDDLDGIAKLAAQSPVKIAFGEMVRLPPDESTVFHLDAPCTC